MTVQKKTSLRSFGITHIFQNFWVVTLPETHSSLAGKIYHFDGIYQERNWDFPWGLCFGGCYLNMTIILCQKTHQ